IESRLAVPIDELVDVFEPDARHGLYPRPAVRCRILARKRIERQIEIANIPDFSAVDFDGPRHPPVLYQLVELARRDPDIHRRLLTREPAPRYRADIREGPAHCRSPRSSSGPEEIAGGPRRGRLRSRKPGIPRLSQGSATGAGLGGWAARGAAEDRQ